MLMKVKDLIWELEKLSKEEKELHVYLYLDDAEDGAYAGAVRVVTPKGQLYEKGDKPGGGQDLVYIL